MALGFTFNKAKVLSAAEKYVQQGKLQNAIAEYEKVSKQDPKDLTVLNTIGAAVGCTSLSGSASMTDTTQGITGSGSITGSVSGSSFQFTITVASGSFSGAAAGCSASINGNGQSVSSTTLSATYSGTNSCSGAIGSGQLTMSKQ